MLLWERAAQQGNLQALLKLGDAHYSGRGTPRNWALSAKVRPWPCTCGVFRCQ